MSATGFRARARGGPNCDSLRSIRAGAVWTGLALREKHLLLWLLAADVVRAVLECLLVYRQLRTTQRRLRRQVVLGQLRDFWSAGAHRGRSRSAYALTKADPPRCRPPRAARGSSRPAARLPAWPEPATSSTDEFPRTRT